MEALLPLWTLPVDEEGNLYFKNITESHHCKNDLNDFLCISFQSEHDTDKRRCVSRPES